MFLAAGASKEFLDEQVRACLQSLDGGAAAPSWRDDQRYEAFRRPAAAPLGQEAGPSSSAQWAAEFQGRPAAGPGQDAWQAFGAAYAAEFEGKHRSFDAWAREFQHRHRQASKAAAPSAWADDFQQQQQGQPRWPQRPAAGVPWGNGQAAPSEWAEEFTQQSSNPHAATGAAWGDAFAGASVPGQQWAEEYAATSAQVTLFLLCMQGSLVYLVLRRLGCLSVIMFLQAGAPKHTPEELKAMKGPSADDPLEDPTAASWVRQFNEELAAPSTNAAERAPAFVLKEDGRCMYT